MPSKNPMFNKIVKDFESVFLKDDTLVDMMCRILNEVLEPGACDVGENPSECCTNPNTIRNSREVTLT